MILSNAPQEISYTPPMMKFSKEKGRKIVERCGKDVGIAPSHYRFKWIQLRNQIYKAFRWLTWPD
jgi:hypothetical protein